MKNSIKACLFDFDGTLVDSMPTYSEKMLRVMKNRGITPPEGIIRILTPLGDMGAINYMRENVGVKDSPETLLAEMDAFAQEKYSNTIEIKDGVAEYLRKLKDEGIGVYLLTASPRRYFEPCLARLGVLELFDDAWSCEDFSTTKSNPQIYVDAAARMGVKVDEVAFFDDNINADTTAKSAGCYVVGVYDDSSAGDEAAIRAATDMYVRSMRELV